jgi:phosphatidyl-myo-inositol dimannoside synthase
VKILLLTTDAYGGHGGIALYNRDLIEAFALMPETKSIDVVPRVKRFEVGEIPAKVNFFAEVIGSRWRFVWKSIRLALSRPNLFVCGHINLLPVAAPLAFFMRRPLVLVVYGIDVWEAHGVFTRWLLRAVDRVWSISAITRDRMNAWAKLPVERYALLPNAIHLERYGDGPRDTDLLKMHDIPADAVLILTVARLAGFERYKGIDEVIAAMPELRKVHPNLYYAIVGDGNDRARLEEVANASGMRDRIKFAGLATEPEKLNWLRSANAFVMPGRGEGFGFVFLEALASGTPSVGSRVDGSNEALLEGQLGQLVYPDNLQSVIQGIDLALASPRGVQSELRVFDFAQFCARLTSETESIFFDARY